MVIFNPSMVCFHWACERDPDTGTRPGTIDSPQRFSVARVRYGNCKFKRREWMLRQQTAKTFIALQHLFQFAETHLPITLSTRYIDPTVQRCVLITN